VILDSTILPREAEFHWPNTEGVLTPFLLNGVWVGTPGERNRPVFVPIVVRDEPQSDAWGVRASRSGRIKLASNVDWRQGRLMVLSGNRGEGASIGHVLVNEMNLSQVTVLAHGIGGQHLTRYHEFLLQVVGTADFILLPTSLPDILVQVTESGVSYSPISPSADNQHPLLNSSYINLTDKRVARWSYQQAENG